MSDLSQDQVEKRAAISKSAKTWGVIVGGIVGLLALWLLSGQSSTIRFGGAVVIGLIAGILVFRANFKSGAKSALCEKCGAAFSRSRTDRAETLASSEAKEDREEQPDKSTRVTTWTEEVYDVVDTYTCSKCGDATTKAYQSTRRRDEEEKVEPYEPPNKGSKPKKGAPSAAGNRNAKDSKKDDRAANK